MSSSWDIFVEELLTEIDLKAFQKSLGEDRFTTIHDYLKGYESRDKKRGGDFIHFPVIVGWLESGSDWEELKAAYDKYMSLSDDVARKLTVKNMPFKAFAKRVMELEKEGAAGGNDPAELKRVKADLKECIVYEDEWVVAFLPRGLDDSVALGIGTKYELCTSRPDLKDNLYYTYRIGQDMTSYFVYFRKDNPRSKSPFIILDPIKGGGMS